MSLLNGVLHARGCPSVNGYDPLVRHDCPGCSAVLCAVCASMVPVSSWPKHRSVHERDGLFCGKEHPHEPSVICRQGVGHGGPHLSALRLERW